MTDVREITRMLPIIERSAINRAVSPSAKYSCVASPDRFTSGSTARFRKRAETFVGGDVRRVGNASANATSTTAASEPAALHFQTRGDTAEARRSTLSP